VGCSADVAFLADVIDNDGVKTGGADALCEHVCVTRVFEAARADAEERAAFECRDARLKAASGEASDEVGGCCAGAEGADLDAVEISRQGCGRR